MAVTRITGMYSGFDTDKMVKDLMKIEQSKLDKVRAQKQISSWKQDQYREITQLMTDLKSNYFDVLNGGSNIRSKTMFAKYSNSITINGTASTAVSVTGGSDITDFTHTISSITQLATKDKYSSNELGFDDIVTGTLDVPNMPSTIKFNLSLDGVTKSVELNKADLVTQDVAGLKDLMSSKISDVFGSDYADVVSVSGSSLKFEKAGTSITILEDSSYPDTMTFLGVTSGDSTNSYLSSSISSLLGITNADLTTMSINGVNLSDLGITEDTTITQMVSTINGSSAGATMSYDALTDKFVIESKTEGSLGSLTLSDDLKTKFSIDALGHEAAQNAVLVLDGTTVTKSSNTFSIGGLSYTLNSEYTGADPIDIKLSRNTDAVYDTIKGFVEAYNNIVDKISSKLDEKQYRAYDPLTDDEKKAMSDTEVELWESKAKSGHLRNDSILTKALSDMRSVLYSSVEGAGVSLYDIGITTSSNYKDNGKLVIDETKLKESLNTKFDSVVTLFTSSSDKAYLDYDNATERYNESGLGERLLDVINNAVRTTRDNNGLKGSLIEKAGSPGDTSTVSNLLAKEISSYDDRIDKLLDYLAGQEEKYYNQFAAMEKALSEMQSQSSSLLSSLGMSQ